MRYMAIDGDKEFHERESRAWTEKGVSSIRVDSMCEGIQFASKENFMFIVINADNVDYKSNLGVLRSVTSTPILIATFNFSIEEHVFAISSGADAYGFINSSGKYVNSVVAIVNRTKEQQKYGQQQKEKSQNEQINQEAQINADADIII